MTEASKAYGEQGLLVTARGKLPVPRDPSWFATAYLEVQDFPGRDADFAYVQALAGKHFDWGRHSVDVQAGGHYAAYQGTDLYSGPNWRLSDFVRVLPNLSMTVSLDARDLDYRKFVYLSGWQYVGSAELYVSLTPTTSVRAGASLIRGDAAEAAYAFQGPAAGLRYVQEWRGGWIGTLFVQYSQLAYEADDPFFGITRSDHEWRYEASALNRRLQYRGFAPRITLGSVEHHSNISLYRFDRTYVRLGITKEF